MPTVDIALTLLLCSLYEINMAAVITINDPSWERLKLQHSFPSSDRTIGERHTILKHADRALEFDGRALPIYNITRSVFHHRKRWARYSHQGSQLKNSNNQKRPLIPFQTRSQVLPDAIARRKANLVNRRHIAHKSNQYLNRFISFPIRKDAPENISSQERQYNLQPHQKRRSDNDLKDAGYKKRNVISAKYTVPENVLEMSTREEEVKQLFKRDTSLLTGNCGPFGNRCRLLERRRCVSVCVNSMRRSVCKVRRGTRYVCVIT